MLKIMPVISNARVNPLTPVSDNFRNKKDNITSSNVSVKNNMV
jgi:hypothetical protein